MINRGYISKSKSPYSSPVVCVRKKDGSVRMYVDYHQLNSKTRDDRQPIPRIQKILNSRWPRKRLSSGFVAEEHRHETEFVSVELYSDRVEKCPCRLPKIHGELFRGFAGWDMYPLSWWNSDIQTKTFMEHVEDLRQVLWRLQENGFKLKAEKCNLFQPRVRYLERKVTAMDTQWTQLM